MDLDQSTNNFFFSCRIAWLQGCVRCILSFAYVHRGPTIERWPSSSWMKNTCEQIHLSRCPVCYKHNMMIAEFCQPFWPIPNNNQIVPFDKLKRRASLSHIGAAPVRIQLHCQGGWELTEKKALLCLLSFYLQQTKTTSLFVSQQKTTPKWLNNNLRLAYPINYTELILWVCYQCVTTTTNNNNNNVEWQECQMRGMLQMHNLLKEMAQVGNKAVPWLKPNH